MDLQKAYDLIIDKVSGWGQQLIVMLPNIAVAILIIILTVFIAKMVERLALNLIARVSKRRTLNNLFGTSIYIITLVLGCFVALTVLNLQGVVVSLLAGVGVFGLALAFAFQDIAANFMSGIFLAVRRPIREEDIIQSGDHIGVVKQISLRDTVIHSFQGQEIYIPNKDVLQSAIINYSSTAYRRVDLSVGISYGDDLRKVREVVVNAIKGKDYVSKQRPEVTFFFKEFGASSINFDVRYWVDFRNQPDYLTALSEGIIDIKQAFDENDIMIPFPIRTLDFGIKGGEKLSEMVLNHVQMKEGSSDSKSA